MPYNTKERCLQSLRVQQSYAHGVRQKRV